MLSAAYITGDLIHAAVTVTDRAYGRTNHFKPFHTDTELWMMASLDRAIAMEF
jgi:hypothetical protein